MFLHLLYSYIYCSQAFYFHFLHTQLSDLKKQFVDNTKNYSEWVSNPRHVVQCSVTANREVKYNKTNNIIGKRNENLFPSDYCSY